MKPPTKTHEGRLALVTGAAQGIGQAIAVALPEQGAQEFVTDLELPHETVKKVGLVAHAFRPQRSDLLCLSNVTPAYSKKSSGMRSSPAALCVPGLEVGPGGQSSAMRLA